MPPKRASTSTKEPPASSAKASAKAPPPPCAKPSKKPEPKNNYSMAPSSQSKWEKTHHKVSFTCKVLGIPRPQYRGYAVGKNHSKPWVLSPSKPTQDKLREVIVSTMARHGSHVQFNTTDKGIPTHIKILFYFPRPKCHYTLCGSTGKLVLDPSAPLWKTSKPDLDNLVKLVMDSINGVVFKDDDCVVGLVAEMLFDPTQTIWQPDQSTKGCTILKVEQFTPNTFDPLCVCRSCAAHRTNTSK